jgi:mRNA-degrading endonuclease toxin of MazEF toxin-antitoxin module
LPIDGAVLCGQAKSLDWAARKATFAGKLPPAPVEDILAKLIALLR